MIHTADSPLIPTQRPPAPTLDGLRTELQTLYGVLLHREHVAEGCEARAESQRSKDYWRGVAASHRHDAESVATVLGISAA